MDKLLLKNMNFHAYHGEYKVEHEFGQEFDVDVELFFNSKKAGKSDRLSDTVNIYGVFEIVEQIMVHGKRFYLIEAIAETIAGRLLQQFKQIQEILIRVRKYKPAVKGLIDYAEIEIKRCQNYV